MKKYLAGLCGGLAVLTVTFGAGTANADNEYAGQTYDQAVEQMGGQTPVIASRVGDYLPTGECLVTRSRQGNFLDSSGGSRGQVLVYLNCNDTNTAGHPGYSVMTPQGQKVKQTKDTAKSINLNFEEATAAGQKSWCEENTDQCWNFCQKTGYCSAEVNQFLGL